MPRTSYQYGTSPRKYEIEYNPRTSTKRITNKSVINKKKNSKSETKKSEAKKRIEEKRAKKAQERKSKTLQVVIVLAIFGMLLSISYREIAIMELFDQKKNMQSQLAVIQKENGQIEKSIREEESKLDWNDIQTIAKEQIGMQAKTPIPIDLEKADHVETKNTYIRQEESNLLEKIVGFFIEKNIL